MRLACVKHAASVHSEPGSNSQVHQNKSQAHRPRPSLGGLPKPKSRSLQSSPTQNSQAQPTSTPNQGQNPSQNASRASHPQPEPKPQPKADTRQADPTSGQTKPDIITSRKPDAVFNERGGLLTHRPEPVKQIFQNHQNRPEEPPKQYLVFRKIYFRSQHQN